MQWTKAFLHLKIGLYKIVLIQAYIKYEQSASPKATKENKYDLEKIN